MNTKNTATKWIATGASMALAAGLGVAGLSLAGNSATADAGTITTIKTRTEFTPESLSGPQNYHYDYDGNLTRLDFDMLNMHLRDPQWHFLNKKDAKHGDRAEAHGRQFVFTTQETLYKKDEIVRPSKHHPAGFWAPLNANGEIDHRYGAWGVAGKATAEIGVGRLIYWDGTKWSNQSHFRVDYMTAPEGTSGYKVEAFREPSPSFKATVSGDYEGKWPSLADSKERQRLVSALAYMFGNKEKFPEVDNFVMRNSERRGDAILQLAFGSDIASSAEKVAVYKKRYAEAIDKTFALLDQGYVTPGEALAGEFKITEQATATDGATTYHVVLSKLGNAFFPVADGTANVTFEKVGEAEAAPEADKPADKPEASSNVTEETAPENTDAKPQPSSAEDADADSDAASRSVAAEVSTEARSFSLAELNSGVDITVPAGHKAVVSFESGSVVTPGAFLNRTSPTGTSMVVESGVTARVLGAFELGSNATNTLPNEQPNTPTEPEGDAGNLPDDSDQPEQPKPEQPKPEQPKPEQPKPEQPKPEQPKPEQPKPEQPKPEQPKPEQPKPADPVVEAPKDVVKTVPPAPGPAAAAPVTAQKAPLAKTGASSMLVLLMAAGLATAGTGVVLARRNA